MADLLDLDALEVLDDDASRDDFDALLDAPARAAVEDFETQARAVLAEARITLQERELRELLREIEEAFSTHLPGEGLSAWIKKKFDKNKHPQWPAGSSNGKGGQFMQVGERFIDPDTGKPFEITAIHDGKVYAHLATGNANEVHHKAFTPKAGAGGLELPVQPAPPVKVKKEKSHSADVPGTIVIDPFVDSGSHDPSLPAPKGFSEEQWKRFGLADQERLLGLIERFGDWSDGKSQGIIHSLKGQYGAAEKGVIQSALNSQYGGSSGDTLSLVGAYSNSNSLEEGQKLYEKAKMLLEDTSAAIQWDLYHKTRAPDVCAFHWGNTNAKQQKQYHVAQGVPIMPAYSMSTGAFATTGFGDTLTAVPLGIRHVQMCTHSGGVVTSYEGEYEVTTGHRMKLDDRAFFVDSHSMSSDVKSYLQKFAKAQSPASGEILYNAKKAMQDPAFELPIPPQPPGITPVAKPGQKTFKLPPIGILKDAGIVPTALPYTGGSEDSAATSGNVLTATGGAAYKPGDFMEGMSAKKTKYLIIADAGSQTGLRYVKIDQDTGFLVDTSFPLDNAQPFKKLEGHVELPSEKAPDAAVGWSSDQIAALKVAGAPKKLQAFTKGELFAADGEHYEVLETAQEVGGNPTIAKLSAPDQKFKVNSGFKASPLALDGDYVPEAPKSVEQQLAGSFTPQQGEMFIGAGVSGEKMVWLLSTHPDTGEPIARMYGNESMPFTHNMQGPLLDKLLTTAEPLPKYGVDGPPAVGDKFAHDGQTYTVSSILKDGTVRAKPSGGTVVKFAPDSAALKGLYRPNAWVVGDKQKAGSLPPGALFSGSPTKVRPYLVLGHSGAATHVLNLETGEHGKLSKNKSVPTLAAASAKMDEAPPQGNANLHALENLVVGPKGTLADVAAMGGGFYWNYDQTALHELKEGPRGFTAQKVDPNTGEYKGAAVSLGTADEKLQDIFAQTTAFPMVSPGSPVAANIPAPPVGHKQQGMYDLPAGTHFKAQNGVVFKVLEPMGEHSAGEAEVVSVPDSTLTDHIKVGETMPMSGLPNVEVVAPPGAEIGHTQKSAVGVPVGTYLKTPSGVVWQVTQKHTGHDDGLAVAVVGGKHVMVGDEITLSDETNYEVVPAPGVAGAPPVGHTQQGIEGFPPGTLFKTTNGAVWEVGVDDAAMVVVAPPNKPGTATPVGHFMTKDGMSTSQVTVVDPALPIPAAPTAPPEPTTVVALKGGAHDPLDPSTFDMAKWQEVDSKAINDMEIGQVFLSGTGLPVQLKSKTPKGGATVLALHNGKTIKNIPYTKAFATLALKVADDSPPVPHSQFKKGDQVPVSQLQVGDVFHKPGGMLFTVKQAASADGFAAVLSEGGQEVGKAYNPDLGPDSVVTFHAHASDGPDVDASKAVLPEEPPHVETGVADLPTPVLGGFAQVEPGSHKLIDIAPGTIVSDVHGNHFKYKGHQGGLAVLSDGNENGSISDEAYVKIVTDPVQVNAFNANDKALPHKVEAEAATPLSNVEHVKAKLVKNAGYSLADLAPGDYFHNSAGKGVGSSKLGTFKVLGKDTDDDGDLWVHVVNLETGKESQLGYVVHKPQLIYHRPDQPGPHPDDPSPGPLAASMGLDNGDFVFTPTGNKLLVVPASAYSGHLPFDPAKHAAFYDIGAKVTVPLEQGNIENGTVFGGLQVGSKVKAYTVAMGATDATVVAARIEDGQDKIKVKLPNGDIETLPVSAVHKLSDDSSLVGTGPLTVGSLVGPASDPAYEVTGLGKLSSGKQTYHLKGIQTGVAHNDQLIPAHWHVTPGAPQEPEVTSGTISGGVITTQHPKGTVFGNILDVGDTYTFDAAATGLPESSSFKVLSLGKNALGHTNFNVQNVDTGDKSWLDPDAKSFYAVSVQKAPDEPGPVPIGAPQKIGDLEWKKGDTFKLATSGAPGFEGDLLTANHDKTGSSGGTFTKENGEVVPLYNGHTVVPVGKAPEPSAPPVGAMTTDEAKAQGLYRIAEQKTAKADLQPFDLVQLPNGKIAYVRDVAGKKVFYGLGENFKTNTTAQSFKKVELHLPLPGGDTQLVDDGDAFAWDLPIGGFVSPKMGGQAGIDFVVIGRGPEAMHFKALNESGTILMLGKSSAQTVALSKKTLQNTATAPAEGGSGAIPEMPTDELAVGDAFQFTPDAAYTYVVTGKHAASDSFTATGSPGEPNDGIEHTYGHEDVPTAYNVQKKSHWDAPNRDEDMKAAMTDFFHGLKNGDFAYFKADAAKGYAHKPPQKVMVIDNGAPGSGIMVTPLDTPPGQGNFTAYAGELEPTYWHEGEKGNEADMPAPEGAPVSASDFVPKSSWPTKVSELSAGDAFKFETDGEDWYVVRGATNGSNSIVVKPWGSDGPLVPLNAQSSQAVYTEPPPF